MAKLGQMQNGRSEMESAVTKAIDQMPNDFEIKRFLTSFKQEVIDMMLAEEQEINALELIAKANEKKGKIIARYEDGMSIAEIANRMNISTKFVENMLTEAGLLK